ncbi:MAG TPA: dienelactone hydrolase family protein [Chitinophagaceae bacterium]|nr:dienelactone hydrolase family protein [Chitinophagaceae bacterium]
MHNYKVIKAGMPLNKATKALVMLHGRGGSAEDILSLSAHLAVKDFALLAPQATGNSWYPLSFLAKPADNEPWLSSAIDTVGKTVAEITAAGIAAENIYFMGFSQGACLTLEYVARDAQRYGGVVAFTGGLIGDKIYPAHYKGDFKETPVFIGSSNPDPHVPVERVYASANILRDMHAAVTEKVYAQMGHTINQDEVEQANRWVFAAGTTANNKE